MRFFLLTLLFAIFGLSLHGSVIYDNAENQKSIFPDALIFTNLADSVSAQTVFGLPAASAVTNDSEVPNLPYRSSGYWIRTKIDNRTAEQLWLNINNPEFRTVRLWIKDQNGRITYKETGLNLPHDSRDIRSSDYVLALGSQPAEIVLHLKTHNDFFVPAYVGSTAAMAKERHYTDLWNGVFLGAVITIILYNFCIWLTVGEAIYIYFVLLFGSALLVMARFRGIAYDLVYPEQPWLNINISYYVCLSGIMSILFGIRFLETKKYMPRMHRFFIFLLAATCLMAVPIFLNIQPLATKGTQLSAFVLTATLIFASYRIGTLGNKNAKFLFIASVFHAGCTLIILSAFNNAVEFTFFTLGLFQLGIVVQSILISLGLAQNINRYKAEQIEAERVVASKSRENERLIREQNLILEKKVGLRTRELNREKSKSDELLLNILPAPIAEELKMYGKAAPRLHPEVSVMFIDIQNFTGYADGMSPELLVTEIDRLFRGFDRIMLHYHIEKVKTIGDAYLCVSGLYPSDRNPAHDMLAAARSVLLFMQQEQEKSRFFNVRVGIHKGAVVAGVVGESKFAYDIWGDTVNVASRMEQYGETGKVNVSQAFYEATRSVAEFDYRNKIEAKGIGSVDMYFYRPK